MALSKVIVIFSAVLVLLAVSNSADNPTSSTTPRPITRNQTQIYGEVGPDDQLLYSERIDVGFLAFDNPLVPEPEANLTYPPPNVEGKKLSCIKVLDQMGSGQNAIFRIQTGGVGETNASIKFLANKGMVIIYIVEFYGH